MFSVQLRLFDEPFFLRTFTGRKHGSREHLMFLGAASNFKPECSSAYHMRDIFFGLAGFMDFVRRLMF
jgi:hypothetical protein